MEGAGGDLTAFAVVLPLIRVVLLIFCVSYLLLAGPAAVTASV